MTNPSNTPNDIAAKLILCGIHLDLTDALRHAVAHKAARLIRHNEHIIRLRVDLEHDKTRGVGDQFIAKGLIEIRGPDLVASVASDDCYKSIDLLVDKLDRLLLRRHGKEKDKRNHPHGVELTDTLPKT
jgi:putative sigma-54 modulation protein